MDMLKCLIVTQLQKEQQERLFNRLERIKVVSTALESRLNVQAAQEMLRITGITPVTSLGSDELPNQKTEYKATFRQLIVLAILAGFSANMDSEITRSL